MIKVPYLEGVLLTATIFLVVVVVVLVPTHTTRAVVSPYAPPCEGSDIEIGSGCCPDDTAQRAHNMCLTQDDIQQREDQFRGFTKCLAGQLLVRDPINGLQCIDELTGQ